MTKLPYFPPSQMHSSAVELPSVLSEPHPRADMPDRQKFLPQGGTCRLIKLSPQPNVAGKDQLAMINIRLSQASPLKLYRHPYRLLANAGVLHKRSSFLCEQLQGCAWHLHVLHYTAGRHPIWCPTMRQVV